jgi:predicted ATPase/DNA-binding winged helix-turn-helix (wHTH) protein
MIATAAPLPVCRFDRFELQPAERRLLCSGVPVSIGPRAFDVLVALVERAGSLVTKDELFERAWPGTVVEENALQAQVSLLRKILGRGAIATVAGSGYRFVPHLAIDPATTETRSAELLGNSLPRHNLPPEFTSFIGRERDLTALKQLVPSTRLLTLTGSGGCGKTRLALRLATEVVGDFADGVWLVELAALSDPDLVPKMLAMALGLDEQPERTVVRSIVEYLATKEVLLVLDNAEHVVEACALLADEVLRRCPGTRIVTTSREPLGVAGERTYRVPSLAVPDLASVITPEQLEGCASARLFLERAQLQQPNFAITARNARALATVCWRLDGIPLAIELAAPRVRSMTVEELNRRLDQRFCLLTGGSRTALPRQRTLRSLIDWSYDLLELPEQALLCRVSVFSGGWTLEAVETVCSGRGFEEGATLDLLVSLVDKSLVLAEEHEGTTRYRLLETVRQYARDRLDEGEEAEHWRNLHLTHFLQVVEEFEEGARGTNQATWLTRLEAEHDNLREALGWAFVSGRGHALGLRLAGSLFPFWYRHSHLTEGLQWMSRMLADKPGTQSPAARAKALNAAGCLTFYLGNFAAANTFLEEGLSIRRRLNDKRGIAVTLNNIAMLAGRQDGPSLSLIQQLYEESLGIRRELDDDWGVAFSLAALSVNAGRQGELARARTLGDESLAIRRRLNDRWGIAGSLGILVEIALLSGDSVTSFELLEENIAIAFELGDQNQIIYSLELFSRLAANRGLSDRSARLLGAAEQLGRRSEMSIGLDRIQFGWATAMRDVFAKEPALVSAMREGATMSLREAAQYAVQPGDGWPPTS